MPTRRNANEIQRLQDEISSEISRDAPEIGMMVFGEAKDQPDIVGVRNERLDQVYREAYLREDRTWLQGEARRDPEQFLQVAERIGVQVPAVPPGMSPAPGAFARAAAAPPPTPALPPPAVAPVMPPSLPGAPPTPTPAAMVAPAPVGPVPVILGPNGQPLPPSGLV